MESLPVFPFTSTVLFPGIVLPLEITEQSDVKMVSDVLAGNGVLAVAMVARGADGQARPPLCEIAGVGRIIHSEKTSKGLYNILVQGLDRVRLVEELPEKEGYRCFKAELIPKPTNQDVQAAQEELLELESSVISLVAAVAKTDAQLVEVVNSTRDPLQLADTLAATIVAGPYVQQELLATLDLRKRLHKLTDSITDLLVQAGAPPPGPQLN